MDLMYFSCWKYACASIAVGIRSTFVRHHLDDMTTTSDSVSAGEAMSFTTRIYACSLSSSTGTSCDNNVVLLALLPLPRIFTDAERMSPIFSFMQNVP